MKPFAGAFAVSAVAVVQIALAAAVSGVVGHYLDGEFELDDYNHTTSCGLSMRGASVCTAAYLSTVASILLSVFIIAMQCATAEGRFGLGFCGPILSLVGVFWWLAYGAAATSAALAAGSWDSSLTSYRTAVVALSWALMCTFITAFFLSAAAASAAARARAKLDATLAGTAHPGAASAVRIDPALAIKLKRFNQPMASPPVSPSKSSIRSFGSSACDAFSESESPKKWAQPYSKRPLAVTSDGLRTLVLVGGEPVPLSAATSPWASPNLSPVHSPMARSPLARSPTIAARAQQLQSAGGSGAGSGGIGTFRHILLPPGAQQGASQQED